MTCSSEPGKGQGGEAGPIGGKPSPPVQPSRTKWLIPRLALGLLSFLVALALAELLLRLLVPQPATMVFEQFTKAMRGRWRSGIKVIENDPELFWRLVPRQTLPEDAWPLRGVISNSQGLREDHEIPLEKKPGELRVLFLGDSCTFGYGLLHHEGFVHRVEAKLQSAFPKASLECINAGVPGYTLFQGVHFLESRGFRYQPDLIVLNFGWNDASQWEDGAGDLEHYGPWLVCHYAPQLRESRLYQLAWTAIDRWKNNGVSSRCRVLPAEFRSLLAQVEEDARRHGAALLLLVWPAELNVARNLPPNVQVRTDYQLELLNYGEHNLRFGPEKAEGLVNLIPIVEEMAKSQPTPDIFLDRTHATSMANERFADAIAKKLIPWVRAQLAGKP
jgi:lysophospholipase L1-like esterase